MDRLKIAKEKQTQIPRRLSFAKALKNPKRPNQFDYDLDFKKVNFRKKPELYRIGVGEQGVLLVEPYKSEILPYWKFKTPDLALQSAKRIYRLFREYKKAHDFVGMDMSRKFLQMGYTRSRRYANHASGRKYDSEGKILDFQNDAEKAESAAIFKKYWKKAEEDPTYQRLKKIFKNEPIPIRFD